MKLKPAGKYTLIALTVGLLIWGAVWYQNRPKDVADAQTIGKFDLATVPEASLQGTAEEFLALPTNDIASNGGTRAKWQIMTWTSQLGLAYANGGKRTTKNSLFDKGGLDIDVVVQDNCFQTIADFIKFAKDYKEDPTTPGMLMSFMGDGVPGFSIMMKELEQLGPEYQPIVIYHMGKSNGEDAFMTPPTWKQDPKNAIGGTVAGVELDGDINIVLKWCADNAIPVNVNTTIYDPKALNIIAATDFVDAGQKYISGYTESRKVIANGKTTNRDTVIGVDAVTTWTPVDVTITEQKGGLVRAASTKEYSSQMPNATIVLKKWAYNNMSAVQEIIKALGQAGDQVRTFEKSKLFAATVFNDIVGGESQGKDAKYWLKYYDGEEVKDIQGMKVKVGGSMVFNLNDAANMVGLGSDRIDRYKVTYETFGDILLKLYPDKMKGYTPYNKIMDKTFLTSVISNHPELLQGKALKTQYATEITTEVSSKSYSIQFETGSDNIKTSSYRLLDEIYSSAVIAEGLKLGVYGHTDNSGSDEINIPLSERRANAVRKYLLSKGLREDQIEAKGYGSEQPISDNTTESGKSKNRRVQIVLGS